MNNEELAFTPATELAKQLKSKQLSPVELTEAVLERIEKLNPALNAFCTLTPEMAREQAKAAEAKIMRGETEGKLLGLPISVKDLIFTKGVRTTSGSLLYADRVPQEDAPTVERVKAAGAVILGKTNTPEFGWRGSTDNRVFGATRNPWNLERTPGGSSGGASAQIAAGLGPLALGTDGAGSVRIPSSFTGIFGLKPSSGRVPVYPASAAGDLSHVGPMTRTVADAALLLEVLAGADERDRISLPTDNTDYRAACERGVNQGLRGLRVAWSANLGYAQVEPEVLAITERAAKRFGELGADLEEAHPGFTSPIAILNIFFYGGISASLGDYMADKADLLDPGLREIAEKGLRLSGLDWGKAMLGRAALWDTVRRFFTKYDLLLTPTVPQPAFEMGIVGPTSIAGHTVEGLDWTPFSYPFNLTGQPAASVPCGFTANGLPVGLQIVGRRFADALVLQAAAAFEALQPWSSHRPPLKN